MEYLKLVRSRHSVRSYKPDPVEKEKSVQYRIKHGSGATVKSIV